MKTRLNALTKYFVTMSKRLGVNKDWQHALRSERSAMNYFNRVILVLLGKSGRTWILGSLAFARFCINLRRHSGLKGLAIVLKVSATALMKCVAGSPIKNSLALGHRVAFTNSGLPKWIPRIHRKYILRGDAPTIRFWLSLCSLYRVIDFLGRFSLSTITKPGTSFDILPYLKFIPIFFKMMENRKMYSAPAVPLEWEPRMITKSGPGVVSVEAQRQPPMFIRNSTGAMVVTAIAWMSNSEFLPRWQVFKTYASLTGNMSLVQHLETVAKWASQTKLRKWVPEYLGKLGIKEEPGKVRVFAMVDWWTQMLLRPLHKYLQSILRNIEEDATFDQDAGVRRGMELIKKTAYAASYDLSAATDRLPVLLQSFLVNHLFPNTGQLWVELLVGRSYATPLSMRKIGMKIPPAVTYSVGQPMGALSSWVMLALTHHFIVQMAAHEAGYRGWFKLYLVLGDDIVIFNKNVATEYLRIMADLGVGINLVKSVVSSHSFEFAKRFVHKGVNLSALSFKELDVAVASLEGAYHLFSKSGKENVRVSAIARFRGYGYKSLAKLDNQLKQLPKHLSLLLVFLCAPGLTSFSFKTWVEWFGMTGVNQSKPVNLHSLYDHMMGWWNTSLPEGWIPSVRRPLDSQHSRDIWGDCSLETIKHWTVEYLSSALQSIMWPAQLNYLAAHEKADARRLEVHSTIPAVGDAEGLEAFFNGFIDWDAENSLTPTHVSIAEHKSDKPARKVVGRWLRWWGQAQGAVAPQVVKHYMSHRSKAIRPNSKGKADFWCGQLAKFVNKVCFGNCSCGKG